MNHMPAAGEMNVAEGPEAEGARRATGASGPMTTSRAPAPDPEVPAKPARRQFVRAASRGDSSRLDPNSSYVSFCRPL